MWLSDEIAHPDRQAEGKPVGKSRTPGGLASRWWPRSCNAAPAGAPTCSAQDPQDSARARPSGRHRACAGETPEPVGGGLGARPRIGRHSRVGGWRVKGSLPEHAWSDRPPLARCPGWWPRAQGRNAGWALGAVEGRLGVAWRWDHAGIAQLGAPGRELGSRSSEEGAELSKREGLGLPGPRRPMRAVRPSKPLALILVSALAAHLQLPSSAASPFYFLFQFPPVSSANHISPRPRINPQAWTDLIPCPVLCQARL